MNNEKSLNYENESIYQEIRINRFKNVEFLDFSKFPSNNSEFGDFEHLNYKGAKVFSTWFELILNKEFLNEKNKQLFINKEFNMIKERTNKYVYY